MPAFENKDRYSFVTVWDAGQPNQHGEFVLGYPRQVRVRWTLKRMESTDAQGNTISLDGVLVTNEAIKIGSAVFLGTLDEWYGVSGTGSALIDAEVYRVANYRETPSIKKRQTQRSCGIQRMGNKPFVTS